MVNFKTATPPAKSEYINVGKLLAYKVEDDSVALRGMLSVDGAAFEVVLFYAKDKEVEFAREKGWTEPLASGHAKVESTKDSPVVFWIKAYIPENNNNIALSIQLTHAISREKYNVNLFYIKGSDTTLEGSVSAKIPF